MKSDLRHFHSNTGGALAVPPSGSASPKSRYRLLWRLGFFFAWMAAVPATTWAFGALWFDFPDVESRQLVAGAFALAVLVAVVSLKGSGPKLTILASLSVVVLAWWLTLDPSNARDWQPDVARTAWAEIAGNVVTLHNVRNCDYRSETDYTPRWETRVVDISQLTGMDVALTYWGSPWMAHPILSFQFQNAPPVCFSIETRKEQGESYSAIGGLYRQYELIYICADERDVLRLRTNFRQGEDVYLYRMIAPPEAARQRFLEYVATMNALHEEPQWYNALTTNCTTSVRSHRAAAQRVPWDWRILLNGYLDELMAERGALAGGLPFAELKTRARINDAARATADPAEFSRRIRAGRPGFSF